jgi:hypothetical protein
LSSSQNGQPKQPPPPSNFAARLHIATTHIFSCNCCGYMTRLWKSKFSSPIFDGSCMRNLNGLVFWAER